MFVNGEDCSLTTADKTAGKAIPYRSFLEKAYEYLIHSGLTLILCRDFESFAVFHGGILALQVFRQDMASGQG